MVAITASKQLRFERVQSRARSEDGDFDLENLIKETGWGLDVIIQEADFSFPNESDLADLKPEFRHGWITCERARRDITSERS